jgi:hypothetical protein
MGDHSPIHQAALACMRLGWSVIPIRPRDKRPIIRWQRYQSIRADARQLEEWFGRGAYANLGIVTGAISRLLVLDIDPMHGGSDSLERLEQAHGRLARTVEATTGSGGRHLYFAHPGGIVRNRVGLANGIDVRGDGGYVVAPPSVHPNGQHYSWRANRNPDDVEPAAVPGWLVELLIDERIHAGHPVHYWRGLARDGVGEGERNNTIASFTGHLLWHGVDPEVALELMLSWNRVRCRPPLPDDEVVRTVESIVHRHRRDDGEPDASE